MLTAAVARPQPTDQHTVSSAALVAAFHGFCGVALVRALQADRETDIGTLKRY